MSEERKELLDRCLDVALANRQFEIQLLWQRTVVFWGFVAALFVAVASVSQMRPRLAALLALTGLMFSVLWTLVNRGSRSWQESWELKSNEFMERRHGYSDLFSRRVNRRQPAFWLWRGQKYSVSGMLVALSDFVVLFWLAVALYLFPFESAIPCARNHLFVSQNLGNCGVTYFAYLTLVYICVVVWKGRSRPDDDQQNSAAT